MRIFLALLLILSCSVAYGADTKVSDLTELAVQPDDTDTLYIIDGSTSKKIQYIKLIPDATDSVEGKVTTLATTTLQGQIVNRVSTDAELNTLSLSTPLADASVADDITLTNITQVTSRSHTDLSDIGTLTHAQLETALEDRVSTDAELNTLLLFTPLADVSVADDITLTNITQITNRSHTDLSDIGTITHEEIETALKNRVSTDAILLGVASDTVFTVQNALGTNAMYLYEEADSDVYLALKDKADAAQVLLDTEGNSYITGGNLGIGTNTPSTNLNVVGSVLVIGSITADSITADIISGEVVSADLFVFNGFQYPIDAPADNEILKYDSTLGRFNYETDAGSTTPQGSIQCVQYNVDGTNFGGDDAFLWNPEENALIVKGVISVDIISADLISADTITADVMSADAMSADIFWLEGVKQTRVEQKDITIMEPDQVFEITQDVCMFCVDTYNYPSGIDIVAIRVTASESVTANYSLVEWETTDWTTANAVSIDGMIALSAAAETTETTITNPVIEAGNYVIVAVDNIDINFNKVTVWYTPKN